MVLKLYGATYSTNTARVVLILHELHLPFELHPIDFSKNEQKSIDYTEKNPFGQVPYLDDDGFILYESRAICHYLAMKYPCTLIPTDPKSNALFHQACWVEAFNFYDPGGKAYYEKVVKPSRGLTTDMALFDAHMATLNAKLDAYDRILLKQRYLAGDEITLADLYHVPLGLALSRTGINPLEDEKRPNVVRWWKEISSRPSADAIKHGNKSSSGGQS